MTLPSTIPTKHGEYMLLVTGVYLIKGTRKIAYLPDEAAGWSFHNDMTPDEIIEFLQAYKEATNA